VPWRGKKHYPESLINDDGEPDKPEFRRYST